MSKTAEYHQRYTAAMHAVQSGVKQVLQHERMDEAYSGSCSRKHLRVGVNSALLDCKAIATLLMQKGIFTEEEYVKALAEAAEEEKAVYEKELSDRFRVKITLA